MPRLHSTVLATDEIEVALRNAMYGLYSTYFDATTPELFAKDLSDKTHAVLLLDEGGVLRGFSSLALYDFECAETSGQALFSGDTIIHHDFWGEQALPMAWLELAGKFKAKRPSAPLYWFLIVKGYRTYRYLPLFSKNYYPNYRGVTPSTLQRVLDQLATDRFGDCYSRDSGVISFHESHGHLSPEWADVPGPVANRPEVEFFLTQNPGYVQGHELACITELCATNLRRRARSAFERGASS